MTRYKFIFVVLSSDELTPDNDYYGNEERYRQFKILNKMYYDKFKNDIKFFYIEYKQDIVDDVVEINDFIYIQGNELPLIPNTLNKALKAIEYINIKYAYDYIIHTNLSSIWNIPVLLSLYENIPRDNFFGGHYLFNRFITGTGIFISKDLITLLLNLDVNMYNYENDIAISNYMQYNNIPTYHLENITNYRWEIISTDYYTNDNYEDILYFRIKNSSDKIDINITQFLLNKLYNIIN